MSGRKGESGPSEVEDDPDVDEILRKEKAALTALRHTTSGDTRDALDSAIRRIDVALDSRYKKVEGMRQLAERLIAKTGEWRKHETHNVVVTHLDGKDTLFETWSRSGKLNKDLVRWAVETQPKVLLGMLEELAQCCAHLMLPDHIVQTLVATLCLSQEMAMDDGEEDEIPEVDGALAYLREHYSHVPGISVDDG